MSEKFEHFLASVSSCAGFDRAEMMSAQQASLPVSVRLNPDKNRDAEAVFGDLLADQVPWCSNGWYLKERPQFTLDPHLHAGVYYVQEASSMFIMQAVSQVLGDNRNLRALDLCGAPGGKSTLLAGMPQFKLVVANELIASRVPVLQENIVKWGAPHVFVTNNDVADFSRLGSFFDFVLVDAPCSGSGLFRKDLAALKEWSQDAVSFCAQRQRRILKDAADLLDEGGILVYSTCSFSKEENEDNTDFLISLGFESVQLKLEPAWQVVESISDQHQAYGYRFYPYKLSGEGFFCTVLRKLKNASKSAGNYGKRMPRQVVFPDASKWLSESFDLYLTERDGDLMACNASNAEDLFHLKDFLKVKKTGIRVGRLIRDELIPDHELALSLVLSPTLPSLELSREDAVRYLRRDEFHVAFNNSGWHLIKYKEVRLGWVKISQGRIKNNYPMTWRILMKP